MNPEFLSDGFLFEDQKLWQNRLADDPERALADIKKRQTAFADALASCKKEATASLPDPLIFACKAALDELLANLPKEEALFSKSAEKQAILLPVCRFLASWDALHKTAWEILAKLSDIEKEAASLQPSAEQLCSDLSLATAAGRSYACFPTLMAALESAKQDCKALLQMIQSLQSDREILSKIDTALFCDLPQKLSLAADLSHNAERASLSEIFTICGEANRLLSASWKRPEPSPL